MKVKIILIFLILALVLSACSYQVVEDRKTRTIHGFLPVALAEADTGPPEGERTLRKDIFDWFKTLFDTLKKVETEEELPIEDEKAIEEIVPAPTPLANGARGDDVRSVQKRLREWGFFTGSADGIFGSMTERAVKELQTYLHKLGELQQEKELPEVRKRISVVKSQEKTASDTQDSTQTYIPDGVIEGRLKEILLGEGQFALFREEMARGARGDEVRRLQTRLYVLEYLSGGIDGQFGVNTANALKYFQKRNGLKQTGIADHETQMLLFSEYAVKSDKPEFPYFIEVSVAKQRVYAYAWENGSYSKLVRTMKCSTGLPETPTPVGTFSMAGQAGKWYYFSKYDCWAQYAYRIYGPYLFHSVIYSEKDTSTLRQSSVNNLGSAASHGCIRLSVEDAKWLYENCAAGTKVKIY